MHHFRGSSWVGPDGYPRSWRHYILGTQYLARYHARMQFRLYDATLMAGAQAEHRRDWVRIIKLAAGWEA